MPNECTVPKKGKANQIKNKAKTQSPWLSFQKVLCEAYADCRLAFS